ncbi:hypothetical protein BZA77DRAFT_364165, partial [Pyronema omphalodes]
RSSFSFLVSSLRHHHFEGARFKISATIIYTHHHHRPPLYSTIMAYFLPIIIAALIVSVTVIGLLYLHVFLREFPFLYTWIPFFKPNEAAGIDDFNSANNLFPHDRGTQRGQEQEATAARISCGVRTPAEISQVPQGEIGVKNNDPESIALDKENIEKLQKPAENNAHFDRVIGLGLEGAARIHRGQKVSGIGSVEYDLWVEQQQKKATEGAAGLADPSSSGSAANSNSEAVELVDIYRVEFSKNDAGEIIKKETYKKEGEM